MSATPAPAPEGAAGRGGSGGGDARCPRCGGGFHCGVNDVTPCACTTLTLSPEHQAALARRYQGCLCLGCLRQLAAEPADRV